MSALMNNYTTVETLRKSQPNMEIIWRRPESEVFNSSIVIARYCSFGLNNRINSLLEEISDLNDNWDGDDALAPSQIVIRRAKYITSFLENHGQSIYNAAPGPNGEVMLEIRNSYKAKSIELIFYTTRAIAVQFSDTEKPVQSDFEDEKLPELLNWLNNN